MNFKCKEYRCEKRASWILKETLVGACKMLCNDHYQEKRDKLVIFTRPTEEKITVGSHYRKLVSRWSER